MENQKIKKDDSLKAIIAPSILSCDFTILYEVYFFIRNNFI